MKPFAFYIQKMLDDPNPPQFSASAAETEQAEGIAAIALENAGAASIPDSEPVLYALATLLGARMRP